MRIAIYIQREIARMMFYEPTLSNRSIARSLGLSTGPVNDMRARLKLCPRSWEELERLPDNAWEELLGTKNKSVHPRKHTPDWEWVHKEMQRPGATLEVLWTEWRETCPEGIGYTQFCILYRGWANRQHISMRQVHVPGEMGFVDFAGQTVEIKDVNGGPSIQAQIFVGVAPFSNYTFAYAVASQQTPDWIRCHVEFFEFLGGVPKYVVSDNLKAAVTKRSAGDIMVNRAYRDALRHYNTAPLPARPYRPRDKGAVEVGVQIAQRWILFRLRDRTFFSLNELNVELARLTAFMNEHPFKKMPNTCRRERFEKFEKAALKPLPAERFDVYEWRYSVAIGADYHFEHKKCYYSVPCAYSHSRVDLRIGESTIEAFQNNQRIAIHVLLAEPGETSTVPEHRPITHQRFLEGEPKALLAWAQSAGPNIEKMIRYHLQTRADAAPNGFRSARAMRELARTHGDERFEAVCAYALPLNITSLRSVTSILKRDADRRSQSAAPSTPRPAHENVRGPEYFGDQE